MRLFLARHGNTFGTGDRVTMLGAKDDLPLTAKGEEQAEQAVKFFKQQGVFFAYIYCAPLKRTQRFAQIVNEGLALGLTPVLDSRLTEIDYGNWSGLTQDEIKAKFGAGELQAWNEHGVWPPSGQFSPGERQIKQELRDFISGLNFKTDEDLLVVSSSGRLRYFLDLIPGELEKRLNASSFKMQTGALACIDFSGKAPKLLYWNLRPE